MIAMYDLKDNLITIFDTYKECAKYFDTTTDCIQSYICKSKQGKIDKKRNGSGWCRLFKIEGEKNAK